MIHTRNADDADLVSTCADHNAATAIVAPAPSVSRGLVVRTASAAHYHDNYRLLLTPLLTSFSLRAGTATAAMGTGVSCVRGCSRCVGVSQLLGHISLLRASASGGRARVTSVAESVLSSQFSFLPGREVTGSPCKGRICPRALITDAPHMHRGPQLRIPPYIQI